MALNYKQSSPPSLRVALALSYLFTSDRPFQVLDWSWRMLKMHIVLLRGAQRHDYR